MSQKLSGGCACGAIRFECNVDPVLMFNCHCRDCQRASGSAYAAIVAVPKAAVEMRGEPRYHKIIGGAGKAIERGFCPTCGSHVVDKLERLLDRDGYRGFDHLGAGPGVLGRHGDRRPGPFAARCPRNRTAETHAGHKHSQTREAESLLYTRHGISLLGIWGQTVISD